MQNFKDKLKELLDGENGLKAFCIKNIRYIGAVAVLIVLILILVKCTGKPNGTEEESTQQTEAGFVLDDKFEENANEELNTLITDYMNAYAKADLDTLATLAVPMSDNEKSYIGVFSQYIEAYQNVTVYSKAGLTDGSYLVSASYDLKFYEVDTTAPGLEFFYVETDENGKLFINNRYSSYNLGRGEETLDTQIYAVILQYEQQDDVAALQSQVEEAYNTAITSDPALAEMITTKIPNAMSEWIASVNATQNTEAVTEEPTTEVQPEEQPQEEQPQEEQPQEEQPQDAPAEEPQQEAEAPQAEATEVRVTGNGINIRRTPSADGIFAAVANAGEVYPKLGVEGDWTKIDCNGETGYIKSEFVEDVTN